MFLQIESELRALTTDALMVSGEGELATEVAGLFIVKCDG
jgi:hypothetical protein